MLHPLPEGGCIGIVAPAYAPDTERTNRGTDYLKSLGFKVVEGESLNARHGHFAGTDELRLADLHRMYADRSVDAIFCARGGWGCLRYVDRLDFDLILNNPKMIVGYSDITTLQLAIYRKTGLPSLSGPMVAVEMGKGILEFTEKHFMAQLFNKDALYNITLEEAGASVMTDGKAEGTLLGGCLSLVACQLGSGFMPEFDDAILFIEDVGESSYKIDRYLAQLRQAGIFDAVSGVILGEFIDCDPEPDDAYSFPVRDILLDYFRDRGIPVIENFPYGHGMRKITMPLGVHASLDTAAGKLTFENPFRSPA